MRRCALAASALLLWGVLASCLVPGPATGTEPRSRSVAPVASLTDDQARVIQDLIATMTLEEKVGQMAQAERKTASPADVRTFFLGSVLSGGGSAPVPNTPKAWADLYDSYQSAALGTRLGIPLIYGVDAVHGHNNVIGATIFPHNVGFGAANDPDLTRRYGAIVARELRTTGITWNFAPTVAVSRDERWGRAYESFSENTSLVSAQGAAYTAGLQGGGVVACVKHWIGDGATTGGDDQGKVEIDEATLRAVHLPPYRSALQAGARTVMVSLSSWRNLFTLADKYLITDVLKGELGFTGVVVSDWNGLDRLSTNYREAVRLGVLAGTDLFMVPDNWKGFLTELKLLVAQGAIPMSRIDDAVGRILRVKMENGLFKAPLTDRSLLAEGSFGSGAHRAVAREAVRKSLVLLKNAGGILPLAQSGKRIFVAGAADDIGMQSGGWTISWQGSRGPTTPGTTILQGIRAAAPGATVTFQADGRGAAGHDVALVVVGEEPYAEMFGDKDPLYLGDEALRVIAEVKKSGVPMVVVLLSGRPLIVENEIRDSAAFVAAWLPGTEGDGVADVLFGKFNFQGVLPYSWPSSMAQVPINLGDPQYQPRFPVGFGLRYPDAPPATASYTISTEYKPKDRGWYTNADWEGQITHKLAAQPPVPLLATTAPGAGTQITVLPSVRYQPLDGIGTSLEESTIFNLRRMAPDARAKLVRDLFTREGDGIGLNLARIAFGASDFTARNFYTYDDGASADPTLGRFSVQKDVDYGIFDLLGQVKAVNPGLRWIASPWSPPGWMKTSGTIVGGSFRSEYREAAALYYRKAVEAYTSRGFPIFAMTLQNEPLYLPPDYPGMLMSAVQQRDLAQSLRAQLNAVGLTGVKLWCFDHNFSDAADYVPTILDDPGARAALDGVAFHHYGGDPSAMTAIRNAYPGTAMQFSEGSIWGAEGADKLVRYFRNWARSYHAWVTMLDSKIQPEQWTGIPDPTMLVQSATQPDRTWRTPEYYILGQFSRFLQPGAVRVYSDLAASAPVSNVVFLNPDGTLVAVVVNQTTSVQAFSLICQGKRLDATLPAGGVGTLVWAHDPTRGDRVALRAMANGQYVCAENGGATALVANRNVASGWELFDLEAQGNGEVALKAVANGKYVCADNAGTSALVANKQAVGTWERFDVELAADGGVFLRARANGKYVCADNGGASALIANRGSASGWERFVLEPR